MNTLLTTSSEQQDIPPAYEEAADVLKQKALVQGALSLLQKIRGSKGTTQGQRPPRHEAIDQLPQEFQALVALALLLAESNRTGNKINKTTGLSAYLSERREKLIGKLPEEVQAKVRAEIEMVRI